MASADDILLKHYCESRFLQVYLAASFQLFNAAENRMDSDLSLARSKKIDAQQLAALHDRLYPVVYRYIRYRLDDPQVCEDISSEVFLNLIDALNRRDHSIKNIRAWLLGTASNLINDYLRNAYKRPTENLDEQEIPDDHSPEEAAELKSQHQMVRAAMQHLTPDQQHVLALRFADERSIEETAMLMGKTTGAVKTLQFRALTALKELLDGRRKK
jgi:RNA polymerase sigma-70 factor (ECF subfamily)